MFYKPVFCCNCGEKIERDQWTPLTSRRFCEVCAIEQKQHDLLPRAAIVAAVLIGIAGVGTAMMARRAAPANELAMQTSGIRTLRSAARPDAAVDVTASAVSKPSTAANAAQAAAAESPAKTVDSGRPDSSPAKSEAVYYCGALTRKGTPCSRRVKAKGEHCWQHQEKRETGADGK